MSLSAIFVAHYALDFYRVQFDEDHTVTVAKDGRVGSATSDQGEFLTALTACEEIGLDTDPGPTVPNWYPGPTATPTDMLLTHIQAPDPHGMAEYVDAALGDISEITEGTGINLTDVGGGIIEISVDGALGTNATILERGSAGPGTFVFPDGATMFQVDLVGGGGGGGSGKRGANGAARGGGGGGQGGATASWVGKIPADTTSINYGIGAGGAGGASVTADDTHGVSGSKGEQTWVGATPLAALVAVSGGEGGQGGGAATNTTAGDDLGGLGGGMWLDWGTFNVTASASASQPGLAGGAEANAEIFLLNSIQALSYGSTVDAVTSVVLRLALRGQVGPGGGGGGIKANNTASLPSAGLGTAPGGILASRYVGGVAGTDGSKNGAAPAITANFWGSTYGLGGGGGGGYPGLAVAAGNGGAGSLRGGPGGGGGASANGFASGAVGDGGAGYIRLTCW